MNIVYITGSHPRHKFIARKIASTGFLKYIVSETRESHVPEPPEQLREESKALFKQHFEKRESAESRFFGEEKWPDVEIVEIDVTDLNGNPVHKVLKEQSVNLLLSYGCHMLDESTLDLVHGEKWNIHGGLSPWYRGATTHFWPSYMLEPQMTGMTVHDLTQVLDAGNLIHQNVADLVEGDGIHDLACRAVLTMGEELPKLIEKLRSGQKINKKSHTTSGKLWLTKDWRPEHLNLIYNTYADDIVSCYLNGMFEKKEPKLFRQF